MYPVSLRYYKSLGNLAIYARVLYGEGFYDFGSNAESVADTASCRVYLAEIPTTSADYAWYRAELLMPLGGPYAIELILESTGEIVGDDLYEAAAATVGAGVQNVVGITREQFAIKVLSVLGIYDRSGLDAEDQKNVLDAYDALYQELKDDGLVTWVQSGEDELIPIRFLNSLVPMTAATELLLGTYPQPADAMQRILLMAAAADRRMRKQLASAQPTETTTAEYF